MKTQSNVPIEIEFTSAQSPDSTPDVMFKDPSGSELRVPAFWAGGNRWKVRYASPVIGTHRYRTDGLGAVSTGSIEVAPYTGSNPLYRHGQLRVSSNHRYLEHGDGTPFFWLGDTWWMGLSKRLGWPDDFKTLAADRVAKGFNLIQIVSGLNPDSHPFDPRSENEAGYAWEKDFTRIRPEYFDMVDRRIVHLVDSGLMPCLVGAWGYFLTWMSVEQMNTHWRYLIARYGAYPVVWCAAGEANLPWYLVEKFPYHDAKLVTQWTQVMRYIRATDPYHRLLTIHPTGIGRLSARNATDDVSLLDFDMLQTPHGEENAVTPTVRTMRESYPDTPTMPVINGEANYEWLLDKFGTQWTRRMFWLCMCNGAAGHTYGANGIWQVNRENDPHGPSPHHKPDSTGYGASPWNQSMNYSGSTHVALGKKLFEEFDWYTFVPHPEWASFADDDAAMDPFLGPQSTGNDRVRIIYVPDPKPIVVREIASTNTRGTFFDPVTGQKSPIDAQQNNTYSPPESHDHDWVLIIK